MAVPEAPREASGKNALIAVRKRSGVTRPSPSGGGFFYWFAEIFPGDPLIIPSVCAIIISDRQQGKHEGAARVNQDFVWHNYREYLERFPLTHIVGVENPMTWEDYLQARECEAEYTAAYTKLPQD
jgi:hypothetical protein